ncbi:HelD family protein [Clostridium cellulovorans]|uniref:DNA 3'-5' helicase n=1 Tax=Clostridium cellulovorans (strain ATCC 35296 / DSM 3052 / OCM 3 / 743B) TaxID=573061 RepID=D9SRM9_CLOC7|nr:UvrD-helicase domain-containing protein [Clostridium cellulovorans]ADL50396.1 UvrD/REP helicase [Clostridium cellulovorans 743B]
MDDKEIELQQLVEEAHLKSTIAELKQELLKYIDKRKNVTKNILEYRQKALEHYEDDEDKVAEYFDHETYVLEKSFVAIDRKIKELTILTPSPYFGRVDFIESDGEEETIYVGRFGVVNEDTFEPIVVDWRAPIATMFYAGKLGKTQYKSPVGIVDTDILLKRQFIIKKEKLEGMFDSAVDVKDNILQEILSKNSSSEKLKDIIMTIQSEQDNIIRRPREKTVIVDGVAGSGKTTIALHRVAYLLYNFREALQDKVLILGPNNIFMEYISMVLPTLGEVGVNQKTFKEFALDHLDIDETKIIDINSYMTKVLENDEEFMKQVLRKGSPRFIEELDQLIENLDKNNPLAAVNYFDREVVALEEVQDMFRNYYKDMPLYRRNKKIKRIIYTKLRNVRDEKVREIEKAYQDKIKNSTPEELKLNVTNYAYERKLAIEEAIIEVINTKKTMTWLKSTDVYEIYHEFIGGEFYTNEDLAALLYLRIKLEGIKAEKEIKHVIIDEAQDYALLQFKVIKELTKCYSITIVGDTNQRIVPVEQNIAMTDLAISGLDIEEYSLNKSYRSTQEIMEYANSYLRDDKIVPLVRNGEEVISYEAYDDEDLIAAIEDSIEEFEEKKYESVAIITKSLEETKKIGGLLKSFDYIKVYDSEELIYKGGNIVIPSYLAKGLEFDGVILINTHNKTTDLDSKLSYVMSTRALHGLRVIEDRRN